MRRLCLSVSDPKLAPKRFSHITVKHVYIGTARDRNTTPPLQTPSVSFSFLNF